MVWLYSSAILLGSFLLFLVQPICAKTLLPLVGGTPAAWNTCMVFFQAALLAGYRTSLGANGWASRGVRSCMQLAGVCFLVPIALPNGVHEAGIPCCGCSGR